MEWTDEDKKRLLSFKDVVDSDDIKIKEDIKKVLLNNKYIIHVLNNKELEEVDAEPDDYFGINILPYYMVTPTQHNVKNYLCYEISYDKTYESKVYKRLRVVFYILCEQKDIIDKETGIARHDLLAALVQDTFNYTNYLGYKSVLVSDVASTVDNDFACRILTFEQYTDNNLVKTKDGVSILANKELHVIGEKTEI